tara:strand:- start:4049 stop:4339 length:291 start_codon:yes stop_codon:yes gene_type:complete
MEDDDNVLDLFSSVTVVISPHNKGFICGVIDPKSPAERDICSYVAKGLVRFVTTNADLIYDEGIQGFYDDDVRIDENEKEKDNVIDLFNFKKGDLN